LNEVGIEKHPLGESFRDGRALIWASKLIWTLERRLVMIIYLIAAAVVICGCLFFFMRARSRD
jgi:hypothetical protein